MGIHPKVDYINARHLQPQPDSYEALERSVSWSLGELTIVERQRLKNYYQRCLNDGVPLLDSHRRWAFISWDIDNKCIKNK